MKILVLGSGGIGGFFGSYLVEAGADVTFLVRSKRKEILSINGLNIVSSLGNLSIKPKTILSEELKPIYDVIIVTCKTYDLDQAILDLRPIKGKGMIIPFLNGINHIEKLDKEFGSSNVMGGVAHISSNVNEQGTIEHFSEFKKLTFGNRNLINDDKIKSFYEICQKTKFDSVLSENINLDLWKKWVFISTVAGATSLFRSSLGEITKHDYGKKVVIDLFHECAEIAKLNGYDFDENEKNVQIKTVTNSGSPIKASMLRDVEKKSLTEHEEIFGDLIVAGNKYNVNCPILMSSYIKMKIYQETGL
ncbi:MAG: 2-dehydropantoate 2-reductase [Proteobacteria bacterium]|jgi:2-dehydropantoate 2-reductase|nr:2-dehydropantoate 2-reductase [Pseudomonadota bacterium]MDA1135758.1 2-dehydropantoate 2-reductase [Pseudomonadota bacterium]|tara:strand:- start:711 stop:1625 length:915 start_codon:yes stop_codon:yes gene_type:complete